MKKTIETSFKRIETKYIVAKDDVKDLIKDLVVGPKLFRN